MSIEMTQLNVRMPKELKTNVDEVLRRNRTTSSEVIRDIWVLIQNEQRIPNVKSGTLNSLPAQQSDEDEARRARIEAFENRPILQVELAKHLGVSPSEIVFDDVPFDELKEEAMNEWYEEKLARCTL